jgi:uncharacterized protein
MSGRMLISFFLNPQRELRNGWWVLIFFCALAAILVPLIVISREGDPVGLGAQAVSVFAASCICQLLRRRPLSELIGRFDLRWPKQFLMGSLLGTLLMLVPAAFLSALGYVRWQWSGIELTSIAPAVGLWIGVSAVEELVFRGFIFQRMIAGVGEWPAQLVLAGYFLIIHSATVLSVGQQKYLAGANIILASIMFGLAFIRTKSLAMPVGIHFAADLTQGTVLGVGVSGADQVGLLRPIYIGSSNWLSGGPFGLEASVPGLVCVAALAVMLYCWAPHEGRNSLAWP